jgi:cytochrome P450
VGVVSQLLVGGNETTTSLITNCVWRLLERPELWREVCASPALVPAAIEESLRFDPPVLGLFRTTTREVRLHGVAIPARAKVMLSYAAANRDPAVFHDPDRFRLDRPRNEASEHLAFGLGVHFCLGSALARLEAETALRALTARFPLLALEGPGERIKPFFLWGRRRLPLRIPVA